MLRQDHSHHHSTASAHSAGSTALNRRQMIGRLAAAGFATPVIASILAERGFAQDATPAATPSPAATLAGLGKDERLIAQGTTTFETPMELVDGLLTPNELFFIRSNGPVSVDIDPAAWRLNVSGLVNEELELSLADLQAMPTRTITAFLECSGNSRGRFGSDPAEVDGTKWGNGAIGNAEWTGVSVAEILNQAGVQEGAIDVVSQGGDFEDMQRGLPLEIALDPDVMLVWQMNGEDLPKPNGGPVRLLVPGWGGIASTKWIVGLDVIDHAFDGTFNVESYVFIDADGTVTRPVTTMPVKSVITSPAPDASVSAGSQTISGFAWSGYAGIATVEVSTDGGANWAEASIVEEAGPLSWVRFEHPWDAAAGDAVLSSRATDERGLRQPNETPWNAKGYLMNAIFQVPVSVS
ncbi:MAG: sulfite oxidase [Chloroflexota bacterium]|nr:sulfite oxidase [Chloroflexota bacterium]